MSLLLPALALLLGCEEAVEVSYEQFNADDDVIQVDVGVAETTDARAVELHSTTGMVVVGEAEISPGGGPSGTLHELIVRVDAEYDDIVDRVSVRVSSDGRGADEYNLRADSADEGLYTIELTSYADDGEQRIDDFTLRLWDEVDGADGQTDTGA